MMTVAWNNITFINKETGEEIKFDPNSMSHFSYDDCDDDKIKQSINVQNSYKFECTIKDPWSEDLKKLFEGDTRWKTACRLSDQLNDLIEEYHVPGTPRRERRAIKREFDKIFAIFRKHCQKSGIEYSFQQSNK